MVNIKRKNVFNKFSYPNVHWCIKWAKNVCTYMGRNSVMLFYIYFFPHTVILLSSHSRKIFRVIHRKTSNYFQEISNQVNKDLRSTPAAKKLNPFASVWYEIGILWHNIKPVKSHTTALSYWLQTDMNQIFQMRYCGFL